MTQPLDPDFLSNHQPPDFPCKQLLHVHVSLTAAHAIIIREINLVCNRNRNRNGTADLISIEKNLGGFLAFLGLKISCHLSPHKNTSPP